MREKRDKREGRELRVQEGVQLNGVASGVSPRLSGDSGSQRQTSADLQDCDGRGGLSGVDANE